MRNNCPIIHRKFVVTSTYCIKDRSIYTRKWNFIKENYAAFKRLFNEIYISMHKWWHHPIAQKLEMKIRIKFGYSPRTYSHDILWHFKGLFNDYELYKNIK